MSPQWLTVDAPEQPDLPTWQRLSGVPLALPALHQTLRSPCALESPRQRRGQFAFVRAVGVSCPLRIDLVVDRNEGGLTTHSEPRICCGQPFIHPGTERVDLRPRPSGVRPRDTRILMHPGHDIGEFQKGFTRLRRAGDGRRRLRMWGCRQRDVAFAGEQTRGRVQADPPRAGDVHLGPCVQIGEVGRRARRPVEGRDVGGQLDQVPRDESGGQTHLPQNRDEQPRGVAAGSDTGAQREIRCLHTCFHSDAVADVGIDRAVERHQKVDGAGARDEGEVVHPRLGEVTWARALTVLVDQPQVGLEILSQRLRVLEAGR